MTVKELEIYICMICRYRFYRRGTPRKCPNCKEALYKPQPAPDGTILMFEKGGSAQPGLRLTK